MAPEDYSLSDALGVHGSRPPRGGSESGKRSSAESREQQPREIRFQRTDALLSYMHQGPLRRALCVLDPEGWIRTGISALDRRALSQLSYLGVVALSVEKEWADDKSLLRTRPIRTSLWPAQARLGQRFAGHSEQRTIWRWTQSRPRSGWRRGC